MVANKPRMRVGDKLFQATGESEIMGTIVVTSENLTSIFWRGLSSVVFDTDSWTGNVFVATKANFERGRLAYDRLDIEMAYQDDPPLKKLMKELWTWTKGSEVAEVLGGEVIFTSRTRAKGIVNGQACLLFPCGEATYAVPVAEPLASAIGKARLGVVLDTRYTANEQSRSAAARHITSALDIHLTDVWITQAT